MGLRKWLLIFFGTLLLCALLFAGLNLAADPFGVFGDRLLDWYGYNMTMNPRVAKIAYLEARHGDYDSYVIGSSRASSLSVAELNGYLDARFYNMTWYGGDLKDEDQLVRYLIDNYEVRNIVLTVDPQNAVLFDTQGDAVKDNMHCKVDGAPALPFYGRYLFANPAYAWDKLLNYTKRGYLQTGAAVYVPETGSYNKQRRDATPIGDLEEYLALENNVFTEPASGLPRIREALEAVADIRDVCAANGVNFLMIGVPMHNDDFYRYDFGDLAAFWRGLAALSDFYDFWGDCSVNADIRYYYDTEHFRNCVGTMVLAYIFQNDGVYLPEGFGHRTTADNVEARIAETLRAPRAADTADYTARVPILMYHSFTEDPEQAADATAYIGDFEKQLAALREAGYQSVSWRDLIAYVTKGTALPEKPVLLSFDDGYRNNLTLAVPLLERYGFTASIAVIGVSVGKDTYKDSGIPIIPHFALTEAAPLAASGVLEMQSHSYDMHQVPALDGADCRQGVLRKPGESEADYVAALTADYLRSRAQLEAVPGVVCDVFVYPSGLHDTLSEAVLHSLGARVTVTTVPGTNVLLKGVPQSLYLLKRVDVTGGTDAAALLEQLTVNS